MRKAFLGCVVLCLVAIGRTVAAQGVDADLSGRITDRSGGRIGRATVTVASADAGRVRTVTADDVGQYQVPVLPAGDYTITVEAPQFGVATRRVRLAVGEAAVVDVELEAAAVKETVLVVAAVPRAAAGLGSVIDRQQVDELPLNGRDLQRLAWLVPGVYVTTNRNSGTVYTHGMKLNVNGAGPRSNAFLLDGTSTADFYNNGFGSAAGNVLGADAFQEFRVLTGGYSAQYGGAAGGIVSIVSRSGANRPQASVFEFFRNDALDAREVFDTEKPDFTRHQFGVSLGGPLVKNRSFLFGAVEVLRERLGLTRVTTVPSVAARNGLLPDPAIPGATIAVNPSVRPYLDLFPLPNGQDFGDGLAEHTFGAVQDTRQTFVQVRLDQTISDSQHVFVRATTDNAVLHQPANYPGLPIDWDSANRFVTAQAGQVIGSRAVNTIRVGYSRTNIGQTDAGPRSASASLAVVPGRPMPQLVIGGMPNFGTLTAPTTRAIQNLWSIADEVAVTRGAHLLKAGASLDHYDAFSDYQFYFGGRYSFPNVQRFLQGRPSVLLVALPGSDSVRNLTSMQFGSFVQAELRLAPTMTLNLGVRWEFSTEPQEQDGRLVTLIDPLRDTTVTVGQLLQNHKTNIAPRAAFSWRPGDGRTVISSSAGRFFDVNTLPFIGQLLNNPPFFTQVTINNPSFPNPPFGAAPVPSLSVPSFDWKTPEMVHYNASVEREVGWQSAVTVSVSGSRGYNLVRSGDINTPIPQVTADGTSVFPAGAERRNPNFGAIALRTTSGRSWYRALSIGARRRADRGLQVQANYAWSRATDEVQGTLPTEALGSVTQWLDPDHSETDRGPADFDRTHVLQMNAVWDLPGTGRAGGLLRGWSLSGVLTAQSGNPFTPGIQTDWTRTLARVAVDRPDWNPGFTGNVVLGGPQQYFDPAAFKLPTAGTFGNVGRNTLVGPGLMTVDVAAMKDLAIPKVGRDSRVQLRLEVFNLFNRANYGLPQRLVFAGTLATEPPLANAGRITTTTTSARQAQLAVKWRW